MTGAPTGHDPESGLVALPESPFTFLPVVAERLGDLQRFSESHGKFRYCSCMKWRMPSGEYGRSTKDERIARLDELVSAGTPVGILGYHEDEPVGWCSIAPRTTYEGLERSRVLPRIDDAPVWSVACFFVDRQFRNSGLTGQLLSAGISYARAQGAEIIEGYPVEPDAASYTFMGSPGTFERAGMADVTPDGQKRRVMRSG